MTINSTTGTAFHFANSLWRILSQPSIYSNKDVGREKARGCCYQDVTTIPFCLKMLDQSRPARLEAKVKENAPILDPMAVAKIAAVFILGSATT
jgi:hypothetical protein